MSKAFFAHSQKTYGTKEEKLAKIKIKSLFQLVCPYEDIYKPNPSASNSDYNAAIDKCGCVVFLPFHNHIGRGVYSNVAYALSKKYPVYVYDVEKNVLRSVKSVTIVNPDDWAVKYAKWQESSLDII